MANFNTHITTAFIISSTTSLVLYKAGMLSPLEFFLCAITGTVGGLLPDIDLAHAVPARVGFNLLSILTAFGAVILWIGYLTFVELLAVGLISYSMMRWGVFLLFSSLTRHRGIVHSIPYMGVLSVMLVHVSFYGLKNGVVFSWFLGWFLFFGALIHLLLDEIYSVNVFGLRLKKSFGTAMKFFDTNQKTHYFLLYVILAILLLFAPSYQIFWQTITEPTSWQLLKQNLLPAYMHRY
ncbi:hypothetical protein MOMA_04225 [Moraxella macacae 0408225]|uniref:Membrane-bound metal-dependent hydrolase n=1 Tax=Moraxella macacae 0408225 TaxID=1230338 RepID=L2FA19_9GAMM|nr:metal-dependent hydrolase [Moraxella macacae]ELA09581.1 hypothetical protein MOMA_04225 [Moraxella macacae 0408225]